MSKLWLVAVTAESGCNALRSYIETLFLATGASPALAAAFRDGYGIKDALKSPPVLHYTACPRSRSVQNCGAGRLESAATFQRTNQTANPALSWLQAWLQQKRFGNLCMVRLAA
jgi:hypothetical protein